MTDQHDVQDAELLEEPVAEQRRAFLRGLGKWSQAVIGGVLLGGAMSPSAQASSWVNRRGGWEVGGGSWINRPGGWVNRGGSWVNRSGGGWVNRSGGGWVNRGGSWVNRSGGGGWVNRRGGGGAGWINR